MGAVPLRFVAGFPHLWQVLQVFLLSTSSIICPLLSMVCAIIFSDFISKGMLISFMASVTFYFMDEHYNPCGMGLLGSTQSGENQTPSAIGFLKSQFADKFSAGDKD
jgi:hypothetical protein